MSKKLALKIINGSRIDGNNVPPDKLEKMKKIMANFARSVENKLALPKNRFLLWTGSAEKTYNGECRIYITAHLYQKTHGWIPKEINSVVEEAVITDDTLKRGIGIDWWLFVESAPFEEIVTCFVDQLK